jgi:opacity protein-like surface antigen
MSVRTTRRLDGDSRSSHLEITPFVSLGSVGSSRIGAAIRFAWTSQLGVETEVGYGANDIHALGASVNLLYGLPRVGRVTPYVAGGIGLQQYGTAFDVPTLGVITQSRTTLSINAGGGVKVRVNQNWGVRTDVRCSNGLSRFAPEDWRVYNGVTFRTGSR